MMSFFRTIPVAEATGKLKALYDEDVRLHGEMSCGEGGLQSVGLAIPQSLLIRANEIIQ